jgi:AcrR family transcriptional regulator
VARPQTPRSTRRSVDDWIGAALELIAEEGVGADKIDRLCGRLGVTKGSFYWHFDDLASFLAAVAERWGESRDALRDSFASLADVEPRERISAMLELMLDPDSWALERAVREWAQTDDGVRKRVARTDRWIFEEVRRAMVELGFDKEDAEIRARGLFYASVGFIHAAPRTVRGGARQRARLVEILTS